PHKEYAFVCFRFYTGSRPSEAVALKWGSVDLRNRKAAFAVSRHLGEENAPKTRASHRTVTLLPNVVELLQTLLPLHVGPESYVFTDAEACRLIKASLRGGFKAYCECSRFDHDHSTTRVTPSLALLSL